MTKKVAMSPLIWYRDDSPMSEGFRDIDDWESQTSTDYAISPNTLWKKKVWTQLACHWARSIGILEVLLKINIKYLPARLGFYRFRKHFLKFRPRLGRSRSTARGSTVVVKWRKKTSEELCYITFFFPIKLHLGQSDHNIRFISKHQS